MSVADMLAAARGEKTGGAAAAAPAPAAEPEPVAAAPEPEPAVEAPAAAAAPAGDVPSKDDIPAIVAYCRKADG